LRARVAGRLTRWFAMGEWSAGLDGGHRRSIPDQAGADGRVDTDVLTLAADADAVQVRAHLHAGATGESPQLRMLAVCTGPDAAPAVGGDAFIEGWGADLDVPERTQRVAGSNLWGGGDAWCSPASVSMVMAYWAARCGRPAWAVDVATAAAGIFDPVYGGCGNWPFSVAFAAEHGMRGYVARMPGLPDIERRIAAGAPVIASIRAAPGELRGAPYAQTEGHLLVVRGFTPQGGVVCNDPYAGEGSIRRVYDRAEFARAWLTGSRGAVYLLEPPL
ncbi:MAG TPA: peptidase C39 family protein, partial [Candidatus Eremiobacteraceae bacterium]|nr:peptidase C39 family protein [Candidatus Eremiobacteraceae bacterium]